MGAVTLSHRFDGNFNLNTIFHILLLDGVCTIDDHGKIRFHRVELLVLKELTQLIYTISHKFAHYLSNCS